METHDLDKTYGFIKRKDSRTSYDPNEISSKTQIPKNKNSNTKISRILHKMNNLEIRRTQKEKCKEILIFEEP